MGEPTGSTPDGPGQVPGRPPRPRPRSSGRPGPATAALLSFPPPAPPHPGDSMPRPFVRAFTAALFLILALHPAGARATITPEAERVVRRYLEATGGEAAFAAESTLYTRARVEAFGFTGTLESWIGRPDRRASRTELGPFKLREGGRDGRAWRTDPTTDRIVTLADHDLRESEAGAWFERERWAEPGQGGGDVRLASAERDSASGYAVLEVRAPANPSAKPRRLWFRDRDGLLARVEAPRDAGLVVTEFADWRLVAGRLRPFRTVTRAAHMPANVLTATTDSLAVNAGLAGVEFDPPGARDSGVTWARTPGRAVIPFDYRARHLWVKVRLADGSLHDVLFDTGASVTVLDSAFARRMGLATEGFMQAAGAGAAGSASFAELPELSLVGEAGDGIAVRGLRVGVLSVSPSFAPYFWREVPGVIGYDVISRFHVTVDYDASRLTLRDPAAGGYEGPEPPLRMVMNGTVPAVEATVDGHTGLFRLDLGSSSTVDLHTPFVRRHGLVAKLRHPMRVTGTGFGGEFASTLGRLGRMQVGRHAWDDPMVTCADAAEGAFASEEFAGNIGNRLLERFRVTLDYERRQVVLEPGARAGQRDRFTQVGALLTMEPDSHVVVRAVLEGSPAMRGGLREGDRVLRIDGRGVREWDAGSLEARFEGGSPGGTVTLDVERGGRGKRVRIQRREVLP